MVDYSKMCTERSISRESGDGQEMIMHIVEGYRESDSMTQPRGVGGKLSQVE